MLQISETVKKIKSYFNIKTKKGRVRTAVLMVLLLLCVLALGKESTKPEVEESEQLHTVTVESVASLSSKNVIELIGTVEAINQADIQTEVSGRVTGVQVTLGQFVQAGQLLAQLENASEYASLLQAEGTYEAAVALAAQSDVSESEAHIALQKAKDAAASAYRSSFNTFRSILQSDIDDLFSNPQAKTPGVKIDGGGDTHYLNAERAAFENILTQWQLSAQSISSGDDLNAKISEAQGYVSRLSTMLDVFISRLQESSSAGSFSKDELDAYAETFESDKSTLNTLNNTLDNTLTTLSSAKETLRKAQLGGTSSSVSSANAQVKQALGSLRAAQANYNKTILRTPIAGVVNTLAVKEGDFVSGFTTVAIVANNNALEITTYIGEDDQAYVAVGDRVLLEDGSKGTVTAIAPAVDPTTKKVEVKIGTESESLSNGDTVSLTIESGEEAVDTEKPIKIPLTALKFTSEKAYVFTVEDGHLVEHEVMFGKPNGTSVTILEGVDSSWRIVTDARGLVNGQKVTIASQ